MKMLLFIDIIFGSGVIREAGVPFELLQKSQPFRHIFPSGFSRFGGRFFFRSVVWFRLLVLHKKKIFKVVAKLLEVLWLQLVDKFFDFDSGHDRYYFTTNLHFFMQGRKPALRK